MSQGLETGTGNPVGGKAGEGAFRQSLGEYRARVSLRSEPALGCPSQASRSGWGGLKAKLAGHGPL